MAAGTKVTLNLKGLKSSIKEIKAATEEAIEIIVEDFERTSSEAAPHDKGILEQSYSHSITWRGKNEIVGIVDYSVKEENGNNGFDYAEYIHESDYYELGEGSQQKAAGGGATGMSGRSYAVDRKFMTRVIDGESETYTKLIEDFVKEAAKG